MKAALPVLFSLSLFALVACESPHPIAVPANNSPPSSSSDAVKEDAAKEIVSVKWMSSDFTEEIKTTRPGIDVGLLVKTRNYEVGETITVVVGMEDEVEGLSDHVLVGAVEPDGYARLRINTGREFGSASITPDTGMQLKKAPIPCGSLESKAHPC